MGPLLIVIKVNSLSGAGSKRCDTQCNINLQGNVKEERTNRQRGKDCKQEEGLSGCGHKEIRK